MPRTPRPAGPAVRRVDGRRSGWRPAQRCRIAGWWPAAAPVPAIRPRSGTCPGSRAGHAPRPRGRRRSTDPDQSIYAFRGAEARGLLDFPDRFRTEDGSPAPVLPLATTRRFGNAVLAASRNVARRLGVPRALPAGVFAAFREPQPAPGLT